MNSRCTPEEARAGDLRDRVGDLHTELHASWDHRQTKEPKDTQREGNIDLLTRTAEDLTWSEGSSLVDTASNHGGVGELTS